MSGAVSPLASNTPWGYSLILTTGQGVAMSRIQCVAAASIVLAVIVAACSGGGSATQDPDGSKDPPTTVRITLRDTLQMEPNKVTVPAGQAITFVVTNDGALDHEFFVGDEAAQAEHAREMATMGGMTHDEAMGIGLKPGQTKELVVTFDAAGAMIAGCHVNSHYAGGMKATIEVQS